MVDSVDVCKSLNISIGTVMRNPEMLKFVLHHLKNKKMCKHAVKKLPYLLGYSNDNFKAQELYDKAILESGGTLKSILDCRKNQEMCNKAVGNYPHTIEFVLECCILKKCVIIVLIIASIILLQMTKFQKFWVPEHFFY